MQRIQCSSCGSGRYEERRIEYLYSHKGKYLLVPNTPVEVCLNCGMVYYDAAVLKEISGASLPFRARLKSQIVTSKCRRRPTPDSQMEDEDMTRLQKR